MTPSDRPELRRRLACNRELPANSRLERKFCSWACRGRPWNETNRGPAWQEEQEVRVRLHWHGGVTSVLWGDVRAGYWHGPDGCPPECPGLTPKYKWSQPVLEGREWVVPHRPPPVAAGDARGSSRTRARGR